MNDFDPHAYTITVRRVSVEGRRIFSAVVAELPDVEAFEATQKKAYDVAIEAIEALHRLAVEAHEDFPEPAAYEQEYSGRVTLRIAKSLHRTLATRATNEGISLNSLIVTILANGCGAATGTSVASTALMIGRSVAAGTVVAGTAGVVTGAISPFWNPTTYAGTLKFSDPPLWVVVNTATVPGGEEPQSNQDASVVGALAPGFMSFTQQRGQRG